MLPEYWLNFVSTNKIEGSDFSLSEDLDLSSLGASLRILSEVQSIDESTNAYPGIAAIKEGYIPVASCLQGSGDYYYINFQDGKAGALYRIYHDLVTEQDELEIDGVDKVLENYEQLLAYKRN